MMLCSFIAVTSLTILIQTLKYKIKENSIIWSDGWSAYFCLGSHFEEWDYVNHSRGFKNHSTGVNTNRCEGGWKWLKKTIPDGSPRAKIEEYVQLHNFKMWTKNHPNVDEIGFLGLLGRANQHVILKHKGGQGDAIANMVTAEAIVTEHPLPEPPAPVTSTAVRGRGRPAKRRRRCYQRHEV